MNQYLFILLFVALASIGAFARLGLSASLQGLSSTVLANTIGCLLIGVFYSLKQNGTLDNIQWLLLAVALLGALTTFSSYILDMFQLFTDKKYNWALGYFITTHVCTFLGCYLGYVLGAKLSNSL